MGISLWSILTLNKSFRWNRLDENLGSIKKDYKNITRLALKSDFLLVLDKT